MVNRTGIGAASSFMIHLLDPHYNRQECLGHALSSGIDGWNGTPEAVLGHVVPGVSKILRVRDRAQEDRFQNQRPVEDFQREAHADIAVPLFIPDEGAWPRLTRLIDQLRLPSRRRSDSFSSRRRIASASIRVRSAFSRSARSRSASARSRSASARSRSASARSRGVGSHFLVVVSKSLRSTPERSRCSPTTVLGRRPSTGSIGTYSPSTSRNP